MEDQPKYNPPYVILESNNIVELARMANDLYKEGYRPLGGVSILHDVDPTFYQTMLVRPVFEVGDAKLTR